MLNENEQIISSWANFLDLPLSLSVELGQTGMKLRDILDLDISSVIKLSRSTGEGVDVRTGNMPLVRGEIVVIEDRVGVRISEIIAGEHQ